MAISGNLHSYRYDNETGTLEVRWEETEQSDQPSVIFLHLSAPGLQDRIELHPASGFEVVPDNMGNSARLLIDPVGEKVERLLKITFP
jgi:hypothetical protein